MSNPKGEVVDLARFRMQKAELEEQERQEQEREELEQTLHEMTMLKNILEQILADVNTRSQD